MTAGSQWMLMLIVVGLGGLAYRAGDNERLLQSQINSISQQQNKLDAALRTNLRTIRSDAYQIGCGKLLIRADLCEKYGEQYAEQKEEEDQQASSTHASNRIMGSPMH